MVHNMVVKMVNIYIYSKRIRLIFLYVLIVFGKAF